ncbi:MAG: PD40 domain-containing protein [Saprospiraceae bacterium]|nr:PD40 domain-containing protein [Saprospiraceae bacterium]
MKTKVFQFAVIAMFLSMAGRSSAQETRLLRSPAISARHIAFSYGGDVWLADRDGKNVRRLTTHAGGEGNPHFSPDGKTVAFSGEYDGNFDVFTVSVDGGEPKRLTWHPLPDIVKGWTPDGKHVVFASGRENAPYAYPDHFWKVAANGGGLEESLPIPRVWEGDYSTDGKRFAYQMILPWEEEFRNYRGGQNNPIRLMDLKTYEQEALPWEGSRDRNPNWIGDVVFFLSDRDFAMNVWSYNTKSKALKQVTHFREFDCKNLEAGDGMLIFENGGWLYTLDSKGGDAKKLSIAVEADFPLARPHWEKVDASVSSYALSPGGKRALLSSRGDVFSVPAEHGDVRNLTASTGVADRNPSCSPDGKRIAWFSDESGEYQLHIADPMGGMEQKISLKNPTFFYTPVWSPDSRYLSFGDADRNLWVVEVATEHIMLVDNEGFAHPERTIYPAWSPDSKWIAYTKRLKNEFNAVFVWSLDQNKRFQFTDGMSDSKAPAWDKNGKYLYFISSTDYALNVGWLDLSSYGRPITRSIYVAVLSKDEPSPLQPLSDEEEKPMAAKKDTAVVVKIDFDGLDQRILALDLPAKTYGSLMTGEENVLFYTDWQADPNITYGATFSVGRYKLKERKSEEVMGGLHHFTLSADGKKMLYGTPDNTWGIVDANGTPKPGDGKLNLSEMQMKVDPMAEARQIFREAWRFQRDYFYVENVHGLDMDWAWKTYSPWVEHVRHRSDLNYLLDILGGETSIGHSFVGGGDFPDVDKVPVGLLGANYDIAEGKYRFAKIFNGENWNPGLKAPLTQPGVNVRQGDYLLAVNGVQIDAATNIYSVFDRTAGKMTRLLVNNRPTLDGAREVTVVPVADESGLRQLDWVESNRRKVDELSGGKLAYVWVPNTGGEGFTYFNRWYFAQKDKKGAVIDERFNQGGYVADYIIEVLSRTLYGYFNNPVGDKQPTLSQDAAIHGPKVMIINEMAGSGGDMLPYMFRFKKIGPLVGKKTWGGLVGIWDVPSLMDGGGITAPRGGFYNLEGEWDVENKGISPDIEVEMEPKIVNQGRDPQLEKAVQTAMELLKTQEVKLKPQPADPVRVKRPKK